MSDQFSLYTPALFLTLGLGGSLHCLGMCGPLVLTLTKTKFENFLYQVGRLLGYISIGLIIKFVGGAFFTANQNKLAIIAGILLGLFYIIQGLGFLRYIREAKMKLPVFLTSWISNKMKTVKHPPILGFFSAFLPCGLLYTTLFSLLVVQDMKVALFSLFAFWLGTLPALLFSGALKEKVMPYLQKVPRLAGTFLVIAGLITIAVRVTPLISSSGQKKCIHCH